MPKQLCNLPSIAVVISETLWEESSNMNHMANVICISQLLIIGLVRQRVVRRVTALLQCMCTKSIQSLPHSLLHCSVLLLIYIACVDQVASHVPPTVMYGRSCS